MSDRAYNVLFLCTGNSARCDQAAGDACPVWPGMPAKAHWTAPDPATHMGRPDKVREVAREVFHLMQRRISLLLSLPMATLDRVSLQSEARDIFEKATTTSSPV